MMHIGGCLTSPEDSRDWVYSAVAPAAPPLPFRYTAAALPWSPKEQGSLGTCVGQAGAHLKEWQEGYNAARMSAGYLYAECRQLMPANTEAGAYPRDVMKTLKQYGCCKEISYPYSSLKSDVTGIPNPAPHRAAADPQRIASYARLYNLDDIKAAIYRDGPVLLAAIITSEFAYPINQQYITKANGIIMGQHAFLAVGWDDTLAYNGVTGYLRILNSWGPNWGDKGCAWCSYRYLFTEVS